MTVEEAIRAVLLPLASGGVFFDAADFDTPKPYIVLTQIGGQALTYLEDVLPDKRNARIQVNVWHESRQNAVALAHAVEQALVESQTLHATPENALMYRYDDVTQAKGTQQDFSIWF